VRGIYLHLITDEGGIDASVDSDDESGLKDLLDAEVEFTGVVGSLFDSKMQQVGVILHANTVDDLKVLKRGGASPWTLAVTPMDTIFPDYSVRDLSARVRVHGTITYYQPGAAVVLQDGARSLWISTQTTDPLRVGDIADATGFPDFHDGFLNLMRGEIQDSHVQAPVAPQPATWESLSLSDNTHFGHIFDLVSIEAKVVTESRESALDEYVLSANGRVFSAIYHHSDKASLIPLPPLKQIPIGATVRVTGICVQLSSNPFSGELPFDILMRSFDDIEVIARPSLLTIHSLTLVIALLLTVLVFVGARGWAIERRLRRETAALGYVEQRRSRILEDMNGSRPLAEIIEEITEIVSFKLHGAPCWCQIADGARLGNCPPKMTSLRIVQEEIPGRSGTALGTIFAAFDSLTKPLPEESEALSIGAGLATLAIENRRLYTDLLHRSEFDLLTDIQNRFSLEKNLDALIQMARESAGVFGLIYIDLDKFKQVNDEYGHQVGDLYLQEVSLRMKRQLRPGDMLARLGGDEFATLVPVVHSRVDVEEIALRLERCFEEPFAVDGCVLHGSASIGIALYPEDGQTKDGLLDAADAAMYVTKHTRQQMPAANSNS
jgi:diguanylate cyclase (GGDEF)-like protein